MRKKDLSKYGKSETSKIKRRIQSLLRDIVIARDGGCILRDDYRAGACGGYSNDGELILQAEHLNTRVANVSFADTRLAICICKRHHIYFKPQNPLLYYELIRQKIGEKRWALLQATTADRKSYPMGASEWAKCELALRQELRRIQAE